jgi:hypothetical protein
VKKIIITLGLIILIIISCILLIKPNSETINKQITIDNKKDKDTQEEINELSKQEETKVIENTSSNDEKVNKFNKDSYGYFIKPKKIDINNKFINTLIQNNWSEESINQLLGDYETIESRFNDRSVGGTVMYYQTYYNTGLKIQFTYRQEQFNDKSTNNIHNNIYSLVYNNNYSKNIIDGINMKTSLKQIEEKFGFPNYKNAAVGLRGYKCERFYLFFYGKEKLEEVVIYPIIKYDKAVLKKAIKSYNDTKNSDDFIENLWKDYDYLEGESALEFYCYDSRGIMVERDVTSNNNLKLIIYGNYVGDITQNISLPCNRSEIKKLEDELKNQNSNLSIKQDINNNDNSCAIYLLLDQDSIVNCELERIKEKNILKEKIVEQGELSPKGDKILINIFSMYTGNRISIYDKNNNKMLLERWGINQYYWLNNRYIVYDQFNNYNDKNKRSGIFIYDTLYDEEIAVDIVDTNSNEFEDRRYSLISSDNYKIIYSYENDKEQEFIVKYLFNENGDLVLNFKNN